MVPIITVLLLNSWSFASSSTIWEVILQAVCTIRCALSSVHCTVKFHTYPELLSHNL
jgi:hypothetical protein